MMAREEMRFSVVIKAWALLMLLSTAQALDGSWQLLLANAGIASMHSQVTHFNTVIMLDRTDIGPSQIMLPNGRCRDDPTDLNSTHDCTAHSVEFTLGPNTVRPLSIHTDTWCSSGQVKLDGSLVQTGGAYDGFQKIRTFTPCALGGTCDWVETTTPLQTGRWYATNHLLEDGTVIVVGGRAAFTMEFVPDNGRGETQIELLVATTNVEEDNLYPFVNLLPDGNLWIFANQDSIIYDYKKKVVVKTLPAIPDGPRNYPSSGSSVMLPLESSYNFDTVQVLVCGGSQLGAYTLAQLQLPALQSCGRMIITSANPTWAMEDMPYRRVLGDMLLLPSTDVLIINGAQNGSQGWGFASNAIMNPVLYRPGNDAGSRFIVQTATAIPRMYHSTANLLPDGRILVAGSNTHQVYTFTGVFPTELRVEAFSPQYLDAANAEKKPMITSSPNAVSYGSAFPITFTLATAPGTFQVNMVSAPFVTHSYAQNQRLLVLETTIPAATGAANTFQVNVTTPPTASIAPGAYYMVFLVNQGIPSIATWIQVHE